MQVQLCLIFDCRRKGSLMKSDSLSSICCGFQVRLIFENFLNNQRILTIYAWLVGFCWILIYYNVVITNTVPEGLSVAQTAEEHYITNV